MFFRAPRVARQGVRDPSRDVQAAPVAFVSKYARGATVLRGDAN